MRSDGLSCQIYSYGISRYQLVNPGGEGLYAVKLKVVKVENENVSHF